jgi:hypothetical protein
MFLPHSTKQNFANLQEQRFEPYGQVPCEVNLTSNHLTREQDNFHEASVKLAGQPGGELVGTGSFQKEKPS